MRTLISGGTVVTASDTFVADVWVDGSKIVALTQPEHSLRPRTWDAPDLAGATRAAVEEVASKITSHFGEPDHTIDARGKYVIPGGIDCHTHMDMPFGGTSSSDDFDSGTVAAAFGGTTTIVDFAIQQKGGAMRAALDTWHAKAEGRAAIDYGFHMIMTEANPSTLDEMSAMIREGVTSFKMFMAYPGVFLVDDQQIFRAMQRAGELSALVTMHAEIGLPIDVIVQKALASGRTGPVYHALTRPEAAESSGTERAIALAEMAGVPVYMVHLSAQRALERVMEARDRGLATFAETCPQYLFLSEDHLRGEPGNEWKGAGYVATPPLRPAHHHDHLWRGLRNYDLQVVATDHCPFCMKDQKELGRNDFSKIPNGMPGVETRLHLMWEGVTQGKISMNRFVEITATAPAKIFGMYPKKGTIAVGCDADIVVWDPKKALKLSAETLHMKVDYSPYEGRVVPGSASHVISRGELVVENDQWVAKKKQGRGQFVRRGTFNL